MPADARMFLRDPPASTHPAGLAIAAVAEQGDPGRTSAACARRSCSSAGRWTRRRRCWMPPAKTGGLDLERLRIDFGSNAIVERFGADIERGRGADDAGHRVRRQRAAG